MVAPGYVLYVTTKELSFLLCNSYLYTWNMWFVIYKKSFPCSREKCDALPQANGGVAHSHTQQTICVSLQEMTHSPDFIRLAHYVYSRILFLFNPLLSMRKIVYIVQPRVAIWRFARSHEENEAQRFCSQVFAKKPFVTSVTLPKAYTCVNQTTK